MGKSLGRLFVNLPSICLQKQKNRWKETQQGSQISFICTMPSSWLQPALCMSATIEPTPSILLQAFSSHPSPHGSLFTGSLAHRAGFIVCHPCHTGTHTLHPCRCPYILCIAADWGCLESRKSLHMSAKV